MWALKVRNSFVLSNCIFFLFKREIKVQWYAHFFETLMMSKVKHDMVHCRQFILFYFIFFFGNSFIFPTREQFVVENLFILKTFRNLCAYLTTRKEGEKKKSFVSLNQNESALRCDIKNKVILLTSTVSPYRWSAKYIHLIFLLCNVKKKK